MSFAHILQFLHLSSFSFCSMPHYDNSYSDSKSSEMVVACRAALDNLNLWIETAETQLKKYRVIPDSCLEKLAEAAETLQKTLVLF